MSNHETVSFISQNVGGNTPVYVSNLEMVSFISQNVGGNTPGYVSNHETVSFISRLGLYFSALFLGIQTSASSLFDNEAIYWT